MPDLNNINIILRRPDDDGNIGAVCRAMKTMGITSLAIVGRNEFDTNRIQTLALHAYNVFESAALFDELDDALDSSVLSAGITRRTGKRRKYISYPPEVLLEKVSSCTGGIISLVFGNEEHGLTDNEITKCDMAVHIPTSPDFPSLNLSHAVQI